MSLTQQCNLIRWTAWQSSKISRSPQTVCTWSLTPSSHQTINATTSAAFQIPSLSQPLFPLTTQLYHPTTLSNLTETSTKSVSISYRRIKLVIIILSGSFFLSRKDVAEVQANAYNFFASHDIRVGGIMVYSGSVYVSFYSDDTSSNLTDTLTANGLELDSSLKFKTATINDQVLNCTNCDEIILFMFKNFEKIHGTTLFRRALSYMTVCKNGLLFH